MSLILGLKNSAVGRLWYAMLLHFVTIFDQLRNLSVWSHSSWHNLMELPTNVVSPTNVASSANWRIAILSPVDFSWYPRSRFSGTLMQSCRRPAMVLKMTKDNGSPWKTPTLYLKDLVVQCDDYTLAKRSWQRSWTTFAKWDEPL